MHSPQLTFHWIIYTFYSDFALLDSYEFVLLIFLVKKKKRQIWYPDFLIFTVYVTPLWRLNDILTHFKPKLRMGLVQSMPVELIVLQSLLQSQLSLSAEMNTDRNKIKKQEKAVGEQ